MSPSRKRSVSPSAIVAGPRSKHAQLTRILTDHALQDVGPGNAIASERELMALYGVSRATVRRAIDTLITEGILTRIPGRGTFVTQPRQQTPLYLASFTQDMSRRNRRPTTRLINAALEEPTPEVAAFFALPDGGTAWRIDRIRLADDEPIAVETGWYSASIATDLGDRDLTGSIYALLATEYGAPVETGEQTIWAETVSGSTASHLAVANGSPVIVARRFSRSRGRPVEAVTSRYRGDRYQFHMSLTQDIEHGITPKENR